jgi:hypothetical protein
MSSGLDKPAAAAVPATREDDPPAAPTLSKRQVKELLRQFGENLDLGSACAGVGIGRSAFLRLVAADPDLQEALEDARESAVDRMVADGVQMARRGNGDLLKYMLSSLRKNYAAGVRVQFDIPKDLSVLSDQELNDLIARLDKAGY